jgi:histidyl-tRNA synthetase
METRSALLEISAVLRKAGLRVDVFPDSSVKFGKQLGYAEERKIPFALILGPDELKNKQIKVKNMGERSESAHSIANLEEFCKTMVNLCK